MDFRCSVYAICVICKLLFWTFILGGAGIYEIHKARTYIKNNCQVIVSDTLELDCRDDGSDCKYAPVWTVLYDRPNDDDEPIKAMINETHLEMELEAEATKKQMKYEVDQIYDCYHNPRKHIVQWEQPSKVTGFVLVVVGFFLLLVTIAVLLLWLGTMGCFERKSDNDTDEEQPKTTAESTDVKDPLNSTVDT